MLTVEKIGGSSMSKFGDVMSNIIMKPCGECGYYNRIFVVSAYNDVTNWLLEHKKTNEPGIYLKFVNFEDYNRALMDLLEKLIAINRTFKDIGLNLDKADEFITNRIVQAKQSTDLHTSTFDQMVAYEVARGGFIDRHVRRIREVYHHRRDVMLAALERAFPYPDMGVRWTRPKGGLFLWVVLPEWMDTAELLKEAVKDKVAFVPGVAFHPNGGGHNTMRLNFSNAREEMIEEGIARLGLAVLKEIRAQVSVVSNQ